MEKRNQTTITPEKESKELLITRDFDAPRELLWKAWSDPELFKQWWGPKNYSCPICKIDFKVGGTFLYCMKSPEGKEIWGTGTYKDIIQRQFIACTDSFADEKGNIVSARHYGMAEELPLELQIFVTFEEHHQKTILTLKHLGIPSGKMHEMTTTGWNESFDKLAALIKNLQ